MKKYFKIFIFFILVFLNSFGMSQSLINKRKTTLLHVLCSSFNDIETIKQGYELKLKRGKYYKDMRFYKNPDFLRDLNSLDEIGNTPIFYAVKSSISSWKLVQFLIDHGAQVNIVNDFGQTPLFYCIENFKFNFDVLTLLLKNDAVLDLEKILKNENIIYYRELVERLLEYQDEAENRVLFYAKYFCSESLVGFIKYFSKQEEEDDLNIKVINSCLAFFCFIDN